MIRWRPAILLAGLLAPAAYAQFSLYQVSGNADLPVGQVLQFGGAAPNQPISANFILTNVTSTPQTLQQLQVTGEGFSLSGASAPLTLQPGGFVQFTVTFQATLVALSYPGSLNATGVFPVTLIAYVEDALTYEVQLASGTSALGAAPVNFGSVAVGSSITANFLAVNLTAATLTVDAISLAHGDFSLVGTSPSGTSLSPQATAAFSIQFSPSMSGTRTAVLTIGSQTFTLTGTGAPPQQFSLYQVLGTAQAPVGAQFSFGTTYPSVPVSVTFGIQNTTSQPQTVSVLTVSGAGFSTGNTAPIAVPAGASAQFTVVFEASTVGSYTGSLDVAGIAVALAANVTAPSGVFNLYQVSGSTQTPVGAQFSFAPTYPNVPESVTFSILNITSQTQTVTVLSVSGAGFSIGGAAAPMSLKAGTSAQFTVAFQGATVGAYSGSLSVAGITVALAANVTQGLTYEVQQASGSSPLGTAPVNFGSVAVGSTATLGFLAVNQTTAALTVDPIGIAAGDFALVGPSPGGAPLAPQASAAFSIQFTPSATGTRTAVLSIGSQQFTLTGTGVSPPLPTPQVAVTLGEAQSAQQGTVAVSFAAAAQAAGSGTLTLSFQPLAAGAVDPGIVFAAGGQALHFTFNKGDTAASFAGAPAAAFQTGTTAGTLMLAAQIGGAVTQQNVVIAPAAIGVATVTGTRQSGGLLVDLAGFDNTRTAGMLSFTFYDSAGKIIPPGAISTDSAAAFSSYFASSSNGGQFALTAYFPVTGDPSQVSAFTVQLVNSAGTATTPQTSF